jgi:hypothetical protein
MQEISPKNISFGLNCNKNVTKMSTPGHFDRCLLITALPLTVGPYGSFLTDTMYIPVERPLKLHCNGRPE